MTTNDYYLYAWGFMKKTSYGWIHDGRFKFGMTGRFPHERAAKSGGFFKEPDYFQFYKEMTDAGWNLKLLYCLRIRNFNGKEEQVARALEKYVKDELFNNRVSPHREEFFKVPQGLSKWTIGQWLEKTANFWIAYKAAAELGCKQSELGDWKFYKEHPRFPMNFFSWNEEKKTKTALTTYRSNNYLY